MQALFKYLIDPAGAPTWMRKAFRWLPPHLLTLIALLAGCMPTPSTDTARLATSTDWQLLAPGLERRFYQPGGEYSLTQFIVLRIDPSLFIFRVHYRPGDPLTLARWQDVLPGAVAFVNGNYFDPEHHALGLVVADGVVYGQAYQKIGGMLQVQGDYVRVRSTTLEPYAGEPLDQAVQAFPMLVTDGKASFADPTGDRVARRTVAGQDKQGRILLIATTSLMGIRLVDLSNLLAVSDLDLVNAVNLDGGGSTLLSLTLPDEAPYQIVSHDPVPTVLAVYPR